MLLLALDDKRFVTCSQEGALSSFSSVTVSIIQGWPFCSDSPMLQDDRGAALRAHPARELPNRMTSLCTPGSLEQGANVRGEVEGREGGEGRGSRGPSGLAPAHGDPAPHPRAGTCGMISPLTSTAAHHRRRPWARPGKRRRGTRTQKQHQHGRHSSDSALKEGTATTVRGHTVVLLHHALDAQAVPS